MRKESLENRYRTSLIAHCSAFPLIGLPDANVLSLSKVSLEDIYVPQRLWGNRRVEEVIRTKGENLLKLAETVTENSNEESNVYPSNTRILELLDKNLDKSYEELENPFSCIAAYADYKILTTKSSATSLSEVIDIIDKSISKLNTSEKQLRNNHFEVNSIEKYKNAIKSSIETLGGSSISDDPEFDNQPVGPVSFSNPSRRIILSNPGGGKTTLAKRIALAYLTKEKKTVGEYKLPGDLFPVLLYCRHLGNEVFSKTTTFIDFVIKMTRNSFDGFNDDSEGLFDLLKEHADRGDLLLIIDGFDELTKQSSRIYFTDALANYLKENQSVHLILTSRISSFEKSGARCIKTLLEIPNIRFNLIPVMNDSEILLFIQQWYAVVFPKRATNKSDALAIFEQIKKASNQYIYKMARVPLLLSNILLIVKTGNKIPTNKVQVFSKYLNLSLAWHANEALCINDMLVLLSYTAYYMTAHDKHEILHDELIKVFRQCYQSCESEFENPLEFSVIPSLINDAVERSGVLSICSVIHSKVVYQFAHRSLQEYLSAYALTHALTPDSGNGFRVSHEIISIIQREIDDIITSKWKEVLIFAMLLIQNRLDREEVFDYLMTEANNDEKTDIRDFLFETIVCGVFTSTERKHRIFDLLFDDQVTSRQIIMMCDFLSDSRSELFKEYVKKQYEDSRLTYEYRFSSVMGLIQAHEYIQQGKSPVEEATLLVLKGDYQDAILGLLVISVISWCSFSKIKCALSQYKSVHSDEFEAKIHQIVISYEESFGLVCSTIKNIVLGGFVNGSTLFDKEMFLYLINRIKNKKGKGAAGMLLSVFPVNYLTLSYSIESDVSELKTILLDEYNQMKTASNSIDDVVEMFAQCLMLGIWNLANDEADHEFTLLENLFNASNTINSITNTHMRLLTREIQDLASPVKAAFDYYQERDYSMAKAAFLIALKNGNESMSNNLAYMLRRGEISSVIIDGKTLSVEDLLSEDLSSGEPFSVINYALYISTTSSGFIEYEKGLRIVRQANFSDRSLIDSVYDWWVDLASNHEEEGFVVLAWLLETGIIKTTKFGELSDLKKLISSVSTESTNNKDN